MVTAELTTWIFAHFKYCLADSLINIFTDLKLCLAYAIHNFKREKMIRICQNGGEYFLKLQIEDVSNLFCVKCVLLRSIKTII